MPVECERLQGFPDDWTLPDTELDDVEKIDTLRYTAIGNAVTVPVAEWLAKRIKGYLVKSRDSVLPKTQAEACEHVVAEALLQESGQRAAAIHQD